MDFYNWLQFTVTAFIVIVMPGPSMLNQIKLGISKDINAGFKASIGGIVASNIYLIISFILTIGLIHIVPSETFLDSLRVLGCFIIFAFGLNTVISAERCTYIPTSINTKEISDFSQGFLIGVSNPKDIIFWLALMPNFIVNGTLIEGLIFLITWSVIDVTCMTLASALAYKFSEKYTNYNFVVTIVVGLLLMFIAIYGISSTNLTRGLNI